VPCASTIVPRAHSSILWANSSGVTRLTSAQLLLDVNRLDTRRGDRRRVEELHRGLVIP